MAEEAIVAVAAIDLEDHSDFESAMKRLWRGFEPALDRVAQRGGFPAEILRSEALLRSPHGASPVKFTVELTIRGGSWKALRDTANAAVAEAARECGIDISGHDPALGNERSYEQQGTQLVPA